MKILAVFLLAMLLLLGSVVASPGTQPLHVTGGIQFTRTEDGEDVSGKAEFNAIATDDQGAAKGWFKYHEGGGTYFRADIECLHVAEYFAVFGGWVVKASSDEWAEKWLLIWVKDGKGTAGAVPDSVGGEMYDEEMPCDKLPHPPEYWPVTGGNLVIHRQAQ